MFPSSLPFVFASEIVSPLWSLPDLVKSEQDEGGSRGNLRARWKVTKFFKAVTMFQWPFFKLVCCFMNFLMTWFICFYLLYLLIVILSIYLTLYFLWTLNCQFFSSFCCVQVFLFLEFLEDCLIWGFLFSLFSHWLLRFNLLLEVLFQFHNLFFSPS